MTVEINIVCDGCGCITSAAKTADKARQENREHGGKGPMPGGLDLCPYCVRTGRDTDGHLPHAGVGRS